MISWFYSLWSCCCLQHSLMCPGLYSPPILQQHFTACRRTEPSVHSPLKLTLRMYLSSFFPPARSISGQMPEFSGHRSLCMLWRAWAMAYTASITNWTFPSCSYLESMPIRSWPETDRQTDRHGDLDDSGSICTEKTQITLTDPHLLSHWNSFYSLFPTNGSVSVSPLVPDWKFQHLLDGLWWNVVQTFMFPSGWTVTTLVILWLFI